MSVLTSVVVEITPSETKTRQISLVCYFAYKFSVVKVAKLGAICGHMYSKTTTLHFYVSSLWICSQLREWVWGRVAAVIDDKKIKLQMTCYWLHLKRKVLHPLTVIMSQKIHWGLDQSLLKTPNVWNRDETKMCLILRRDPQKEILRPISSTTTLELTRVS